MSNITEIDILEEAKPESSVDINVFKSHSSSPKILAKLSKIATVLL